MASCMLEFEPNTELIVKVQQQFHPLIVTFASTTLILMSVRIGVLRRVTATSDPACVL